MPTDDGWLLTGQKVWTSYAAEARWGICLARTDPDLPKHKGISYLVVDMQSPGIEVRPLRQITGESEFNEVFLDDVFVPSDHLVGDLNNGWAVANTTLAHERGTSFPFKEQVVHESYLDDLYRLAVDTEQLDDVDVADALAEAFIELRILRLHNWRTLSRLGRGIEPGPESSLVKLTWTDMTQHLSDAGLLLRGRRPLTGRGSGSGCGRRRRRSPAARARCSARSSATACSGPPRGWSAPEAASQPSRTWALGVRASAQVVRFDQCCGHQSAAEFVEPLVRRRLRRCGPSTFHPVLAPVVIAALEPAVFLGGEPAVFEPLRGRPVGRPLGDRLIASGGVLAVSILAHLGRTAGAAGEEPGALADLDHSLRAVEHDALDVGLGQELSQFGGCTTVPSSSSHTRPANVS